MGKRHASQYANFGSLRNVFSFSFMRTKEKEIKRKSAGWTSIR